LTTYAKKRQNQTLINIITNLAPLAAGPLYSMQQRHEHKLLTQVIIIGLKLTYLTNVK
jgi:hypothetical protein